VRAQKMSQSQYLIVYCEYKLTLTFDAYIRYTGAKYINSWLCSGYKANTHNTLSSKLTETGRAFSASTVLVRHQTRTPGAIKIKFPSNNPYKRCTANQV